MPDGVSGVAKNIIGTLESGNKYGRIQAKDTGLLSYGRYQVTLAAGTLHSVLNSYVARSKDRIAGDLKKYLPRARTRDKNLATDGAFRKLLVRAANSVDMQQAQERWFDNGPWKRANRYAARLKVTSPVGLALLADADVHGGLVYDVRRTEKRLGKGRSRGGKGRSVAEGEVLSTLLAERGARLLRVSIGQRAKAAVNLSAAKKLEEQGKTLSPEMVRKVTSLRDEGRRLEMNAKMLLTSATARRIPMWRRLISSGDLNFQGDKNGNVTLFLGKKACKVQGLRGANMGGWRPTVRTVPGRVGNVPHPPRPS